MSRRGAVTVTAGAGVPLPYEDGSAPGARPIEPLEEARQSRTRAMLDVWTYGRMDVFRQAEGSAESRPVGGSERELRLTAEQTRVLVQSGRRRREQCAQLRQRSEHSALGDTRIQ